MQTSFMHPPFGFALFYLRGISDQIFKSKAIQRPILSKDIYLGAIPWVVMQLMLVGIVIFWPGSVTYWLDKEAKLDIDKATRDARADGRARRASDDRSAARPLSAAPTPAQRAAGARVDRARKIRWKPCGDRCGGDTKK